MTIAAALTPPTSTVDWKPCAQDSTADCTTLAVPADWSHPDGPKTTLALARRKAANSKGTLLVNPGGPGLSGVDMVLKTRPFSADLQSRFDIVGFDPRGIGGSAPMPCPAGDSTIPTDQAQFAKLLADNKKIATSCTAHLTATDVARDVEAIRIALGGDPLNWYGTSYGTEIGERYAELFPSHIRTMVLDATIDRSKPALTHLFSATASAEDSFTRFTFWCKENSACALHGRDVGAIFDQVRAKLTGDQLDYFDSAAYTALYAPVWGWPALGNALNTLHSTPKAVRAAPSNGAVLGAICQDWNYTVGSYAELSVVLTIARILAPHLHIANVDRYRFIDCQGWPVLDPPHALSVHGAPPILVVNSKHDPITPYSGAVDVSRQLPGSTLLTYEGDGHTTYTQSPCVRSYVDRYLTDRTMPSRGSSCPDVMRG